MSIAPALVTEAPDSGDETSAVDVAGLELPGLDALPRDVRGRVAAAALCELVSGCLLPAVVDDADVLEAAAAFQLLASWAEAGMLAALAELARRPAVVGAASTAGPASRAPVGEVGREFVADEAAIRLGLTTRTADRRVSVAVALAGRLPASRDALASGRIDFPRAVALVEETVTLGPDEARRVERAVLTKGPRATPARLREAVRRAVVSVDPSAADRRCRKARAERRVWAGPMADGVGVVEAIVPIEHAAAVDAVVTAAATALARQPGETRTMAQLRADAFVAPFLKALETGVLDGADPVGLARRDGRMPGIHVHIHADTFDGKDDGPAEIRGLGPVPCSLGRRLASRAQVTVRVDTAHPPAAEPGYRPSRALAEHVQVRDRTCRFPGCRRNAESCELDHTLPYPHGPTAAWNLGPACKRHHLFKHSAGVQLEQPRPGHFRWRTPTGHVYDVGPAPDR